MAKILVAIDATEEQFNNLHAHVYSILSHDAAVKGVERLNNHTFIFDLNLVFKEFLKVSNHINQLKIKTKFLQLDDEKFYFDL